MKSFNPTTPSRRQMTGYTFDQLSGDKPLRSKTAGFRRAYGRNNKGRITAKYRGGGQKRLYREIDFFQRKLNVPAVVSGLEYDPNRTARIARLNYRDGDQRYIIAAEGLAVGDILITSDQAPLKAGNRMRLKNIPQGSIVHNVELFPGGGGKIVRSAGSSSTVMAHEGGYVQLSMPSSEARRVSENCFASIGQVSNAEHSTINLGKAGRSRWLGRRPKVRASVMNPVDHPYGGGEGKQGRGTRRPKTAQGKITGGRKTRNKKKKSGKFILRRRNKK